MKLALVLTPFLGLACTSPSGGLDCRSYPDAPACRALADGSDGNDASDTADTIGQTGPTDSSDGAPACTPSCAGRVCGSDGCGGFCGGCGAGTTCRDGACVAGACGEGGLAIEGRFEVGDGFVFDTATVTLEHKMDVDAFEDGCLTRVAITLKKGFGCELIAEGQGALAAGGGFHLTRLSLSADSQCPGFPDDREGLYDDPDRMAVALVVPATYDVPDENAPEACLMTDVVLELQGLLGDGQRTIDIRPTSIRVSGEMRSTGSTSASCPCNPSCAGRDCGSDGCGSTCGTCAADERCGGDGVCACVPSCGGRECGDDGCGGSCGSCGAGEACGAGQCVCAPQCAGRDCGSDGCGGTCGSCGAGAACTGGHCGCVPDCGGVECGDDGCGGSCGSCSGEAECASGTCIIVLRCGDGACDAGEESSCPSDCGGGSCNGVCDFLDSFLCPTDCEADTCGDGACGPSETRAACASDCAVGCGDGTCSGNESAPSCPYDCSTCGDGVCSDLELVTCTADCLGF